MFQLKIELKRVQTFIFEVPRLKAMLGANALIGQTMRHELPKLLGERGKRLDWPAGIVYQCPPDPLDEGLHDESDADAPAALYAKGVLARDGGHFIAVFEDETAAEAFLREAEEKLAELLPGVLFEAEIEPFPQERNEEGAVGAREIHEIDLLDLPVLQVCQETGREPASDPGEKVERQARSVTHRLKWGVDFYAERTKDIIGLMRAALYPDKKNNWCEPDDLAQLAAGGYLALIHADGNGIGKRYKDWKEKEKDSALSKLAQEARGEAFFHSMRVVVRRALVDALGKTFPAAQATETKAKRRRPYEILMLGGDDLLMICRADRALDFARQYAEELKKYPLADNKGPLHVAIGVAIAQKTYPLHRLHELAESLASSAKRLYRSLQPEAKTSVIDWQVVTQSWFEGVAEARRRGERVTYTLNGKPKTLLLTSRPYRVSGDDGLSGLLDAATALDRKDAEEGRDKAARSPLRSLRGACERGRLLGEMTFDRLDEDIRKTLGWEGSRLWKDLDLTGKSICVTRALDVIGIREIARLGRKKDD